VTVSEYARGPLREAQINSLISPSRQVCQVYKCLIMPVVPIVVAIPIGIAPWVFRCMIVCLIYVGD